MTRDGPKSNNDEPDEDEKPRGKSTNSAPDAVKDPNEKTDGLPGMPPGSDQGGDVDPGGG